MSDKAALYALKARIVALEAWIALAELEIKGGAGSGNWGHAGRAGKRGGSVSRGVAMSRTSGRDWQSRQAAAKGKKQQNQQTSKSRKIIKSSSISKLGYSGDDKIMGTGMTFRDVMNHIDASVNVVTSALPKMKASGVNMKDASYQSGGVFRKALKNRLGGKDITELNIMTTRNGKQAIGGISPQHVNDLQKKLQKYVETF